MMDNFMNFYHNSCSQINLNFFMIAHTFSYIYEVRTMAIPTYIMNEGFI